MVILELPLQTTSLFAPSFGMGFNSKMVWDSWVLPHFDWSTIPRLQASFLGNEGFCAFKALLNRRGVVK